MGCSQAFPGAALLRQPSFQGLISLGLSVTLFMLFVNIILLAVSSNRETSRFGGSVLYRGDCEYVSSRSTIAHLAINALASLVLAASNAAMQCLCAPTRDDIDRAHPKGRWLDIGVGSFRNFIAVGWRRQLAWFLLLLTSLPLHLLYNSVLVQSSQANEYRSVLTTQDFPSPTAIVSAENFYQWIAATNPNIVANEDESEDWSSLSYVLDFTSQVEAVRAEAASYTKLSLDTCVAQYNAPFVQGYSNVILVTNIPSAHASATMVPSSVLLSGYYTPSATEISYNMFFDGSPNNPQHRNSVYYCYLQNKTITYPTFSAAGGDGSLSQTTVKYCLAKSAPNYCSIEIYRPFLMGVIIANTFKAIIFFCMLAKLRLICPLITVGDGIASFISKPDALTVGCRAISQDFLTGRSNKIKICAKRKGILYCSKYGDKWRGKRWRYYEAVSNWNLVWMLFILLVWVATGLAAIIIADVAWTPSGLTFNDAWSRGFGSLYPSFAIDMGGGGSASTGAKAVTANLPQLGASLLYIYLNQYMTTMRVAIEVASYATSRKPLRVSHPKGQQTSSYWLGLPYRFGIPLLIASISLHWSLSQAFFPALVSVMKVNGDLDTSTRINTLAYSFSGLVLFYFISGLTILTVLFFGLFLRLPRGAPIIACNSIAIAAACHASPPGSGDELCPLQYGVIETIGEKHGLVGFSARDVTQLLEGWYYNGNMTLRKEMRTASTAYSGNDVAIESRGSFSVV